MIGILGTRSWGGAKNKAPRARPLLAGVEVPQVTGHVDVEALGELVHELAQVVGEQTDILLEACILRERPPVACLLSYEGLDLVNNRHWLSPAQRGSSGFRVGHPRVRAPLASLRWPAPVEKGVAAIRSGSAPPASGWQGSRRAAAHRSGLPVGAARALLAVRSSSLAGRRLAVPRARTLLRYRVRALPHAEVSAWPRLRSCR